MAAIYSIDGNIGSGKSRLIHELKKQNIFNNVIFIQEPVNIWNGVKDQNGKTILEHFYEDQNKYAFSFQIMAYISRLAQLKRYIKENPTAILITERCTYTDREVFAKMLHDDQLISDIDMKIYLMWFDEFMKDIPIKGFIYVKTLPSKCFERVKKRNRKGEKIPLKYLEKCHLYHQNWLIDEKNILVLNGNQEYQEDNKLINAWAFLIKKFTEKRERVPSDEEYPGGIPAKGMPIF